MSITALQRDAPLYTTTQELFEAHVDNGLRFFRKNCQELVNHTSNLKSFYKLDLFLLYIFHEIYT